MINKNDLLKDLKTRLLEQYGEAINQVILFGSQANNKANEFSDYDVLILLNNDYNRQDEERILDICYEIDLKYDILIDVHLLSVSEMNSLRGKQPIFTNAIKNGIYA